MLHASEATATYWRRAAPSALGCCCAAHFLRPAIEVAPATVCVAACNPMYLHRGGACGLEQRARDLIVSVAIVRAAIRARVFEAVSDGLADLVVRDADHVVHQGVAQPVDLLAELRHLVRVGVRVKIRVRVRVRVGVRVRVRVRVRVSCGTQMPSTPGSSMVTREPDMSDWRSTSTL
eukprot:scaffold58271_cov57-Phaeocystis_antarctica.AAC.1